MSNLLETPLETMAVKKAQMALDDWIGVRKDVKNIPSKREVELKSMELAETYRVPIAEQIRYIEDQARLQAEQIKAAKKK